MRQNPKKPATLGSDDSGDGQSGNDHVKYAIIYYLNLLLIIICSITIILVYFVNIIYWCTHTVIAYIFECQLVYISKCLMF